MTEIVYIKDCGEVSTRQVEPIGYNFGDRETVLCIDLSDLTEGEKGLLQEIRDDYIKALYDADFGASFRSFFADGIKEVR